MKNNLSYPTEIIALLNEIHKINEDNLMDKILSYCEKNDYPVQEIGDILSENDQFKTKFWIDCVNNNTIRDKFLKEKQNQTEDIDEW